MRYRVLTMQQSSAVPRHVCESATVVWECWRCRKWGVISRIDEKSWKKIFCIFRNCGLYPLQVSCVFSYFSIAGGSRWSRSEKGNDFNDFALKSFLFGTTSVTLWCFLGCGDGVGGATCLVHLRWPRWCSCDHQWEMCLGWSFWRPDSPRDFYKDLLGLVYGDQGRHGWVSNIA